MATILVIDDEDSILEVVEAYLTRRKAPGLSKTLIYWENNSRIESKNAGELPAFLL